MDHLRYLTRFRSSRPVELFSRKGVLRNFAKFTGKYLYQSLFVNKVAGLKPATILKKSFWHSCFPVNFVKLLRTTFFKEHFRWLLLTVQNMLLHVNQLIHSFPMHTFPTPWKHVFRRKRKSALEENGLMEVLVGLRARLNIFKIFNKWNQIWI